jgi:hypothetical protein
MRGRAGLQSWLSRILSFAHRTAAIEEGTKAKDCVASGGHMKLWIENKKKALEAGKVGWAVLWLLGVPIPVLLVLFLLRGCT